MNETKKNTNIDNIKGLSQIVGSGEFVGVSKSIKQLKKSVNDLKNNAENVKSNFSDGEEMTAKAKTEAVAEVATESVKAEKTTPVVEKKEVEVKPKAKEVKAPKEVKAEVKEAKAEVKAEPKAEVKEAKAESKVEVKAEAPKAKDYSDAEKAAMERAREKALQIQERLKKVQQESGGQYNNRRGGEGNRGGNYQNRPPRLDKDGNPIPPRNNQGQGGYNRNGQGQGGGYNRNNNGQGGYNRNNGQGQGGYNRNNSQSGTFDKDKDASTTRVPQRKPAPKTGAGAGAFVPKADPAKQFGNKNKTKSNDQDKKGMNKRTLMRKGFISFEDGEDKMGNKKMRPRKNKGGNDNQQAFQAIKIEHAIVTTDIIPIKTLSEKIGVTATEITKKLFAESIMKTINDSIDFETAEYIAAMYEVTLEYKPEETAEEVLFKEAVDDDADLISRPPVVTVMGHVDHGKTSLLDAIKNSNVTDGEAGGITQHIGAYSVEINKRQITFIDTPGHEAFTSMRKRGAQITDIAILVVAADDGVMPQTIEAINHIKAAGVELIVAINKMDRPNADKNKILQQLVEHEVLSEEWGGTTIMVPVSAKTKEGINDLLESVLLVADVLDLKANPNRKASGIVVEAQLDKGKGPVATLLVQNGTLKVGDTVISGFATGRIRAMIDDKGRQLKEAGPSKAVSVLGLSEVPEAGERIMAVENDKLSKAVLAERMKKSREDMMKGSQAVSLEDVFKKFSEGQIKGLNLIVKADVQGSVEAVKQALLKLSNEEVNVKIIHGGVGAINESDVMLASTSSAIIIGFNVRPDAKTKGFAERENVEIKTYRIIYDAIEDIEKALKGMLAPTFKEIFLGSIEVRSVFKITGSGTIAGGYVIDGKVTRNAKVKLVRDGIIVHEGEISSLKRFKEDVKEVATGYECGIGIASYNDIKVGDIIEASIIEEVQRD